MRIAPLATGLLCLGLTLAPKALTQDRPIVAVFQIEDKSGTLTSRALDQLNDYLGSLLANKGYQVVPRSQLRKRLLETKKGTYKECYDESCQIEVGKELAAQKSLASQILKLGSRCKVTLSLFDLRKAASEGAGTASGGCSEDAVVESLEKAVVNLFEGVNGPSAPSRVLPGGESSGPGYAELAAKTVLEQKRRRSGLDGAWAEVVKIAIDKGMPHRARAVVLEKFLQDYSGDNPFESDARLMLSCLAAGQEPRVMALVSAGEFQMGCSPEDSECQQDEKPARKVILSEFKIDATEVTVSNYSNCVRAGRCTAPDTGKGCTWDSTGREQDPVNCVDWNQAKTYCEWTGRRLPTEAEWEKAARGGTLGSRYGDLDAIAWYDKNSAGGLQPVGKKQPNAYGLYDTLGNVFEWCADWYGMDYYKDSPKRDPLGPSSGQERVLRGGAWPHEAGFNRVSFRFKLAAGARRIFVGFRCASSAAPKP